MIAIEPRPPHLDIRARTIDVTDGESVQKLAAAVGEFGTLDVLVNNAAVFAPWSETASSAGLESAGGLRHESVRRLAGS